MSELQQTVGQLSMSLWALSAFSSALEAGLMDELVEPASPETVGHRTGVSGELVERLLDVLVAVGVVRLESGKYALEPDLEAMITGPGKRGILAELRSNHMQSHRMIEQAKRGELRPGWTYSDPEILEAQGIRSAGLVDGWANSIIPILNGLQTRLDQAGASFLDVGTGVGAIAIAMCHRFPQLKAVGIDPFETALARGRRNVEQAGFLDRIELRQVGVEDLDEQGVYDFAQVPVMFLPTDVLAQGLGTVREALRPGGWLLLQVVSVTGNELAPAVLRLLCTLWGSEPTGPERVVEMVKDAGYLEPAVLPRIPGPPVRYVVGRSPAGIV